MTKQIAYSPAEAKLLRLIPTNGDKTTITALTEMRYSGERNKPFDPRGSIRATLSVLIRKVDHNREPFRIKKGPRHGPHSSQVWAEPRR